MFNLQNVCNCCRMYRFEMAIVIDIETIRTTFNEKIKNILMNDKNFFVY